MRKESEMKEDESGEENEQEITTGEEVFRKISQLSDGL